MRPCEDCAIRRDTNPAWRRYDPACVHCGARLVQTIRGLRGIRPRDELVNRVKTVMDDWTAMGHDLQVLRDLISGPPALQPIGQAESSESASPKKAKRR